MAITRLKLSGTPYEMGQQHGKKFRDKIRKYTAERVLLSGTGKWAGRELSRDNVLSLAQDMVAVNEAYAPDLMEEIRGIADATDLTSAELLITNGFTDFVDAVYTRANTGTVTFGVDDCTAFLIPGNTTADGNSFFGQTWDMHETAEPYVLLTEVEPAEGIPFVGFTTMGCIGQMGMNAEGIAVGINNIMGTGQVGVIWNLVVRKILAQDNIEDALDCIRDAELAGAHNYLIMDKHGKGYNVEAMAGRYHVDELESEPLVHTNHCLVDHNREVERDRPPESMLSSVHRLNQGAKLLRERPITEDTLFELTRDEAAICVTPKPPLYSGSLGATIMRPATGEFWAVQGSPRENQYERFVV